MTQDAIFPEFRFIQSLIQHRAGAIQGLFTDQPEFPQPFQWKLHIRSFAQQYQLSAEEIITIWIALVPHVLPDLFDDSVHSVLQQSTDLPIMGGARGKNFRGFLPTGETVQFLLAGDNLEERIRIAGFFQPEHPFTKQKLLWLEEVPEGEPALSGRLIISREFVDWFTTGKIGRPHFSSSFPARLVTTEMDWEDLVLHENVQKQITELQQWLKYNQVLLQEWEMGGRIRKGYRVLFHGAPGTGKTLTASILGKYAQRDVYKIDLSMVVSKFIGETEKNLENLFSRAESKDWILFFDEADALFGKRTGLRDAHDKYANQEVSYLLQRMENFDGLVILASNMKDNMDDAMTRRFDSIIHFPLPSEQDRQLIWKKAFPQKIRFANGEDIPELVKKYELSGGNIINIVHYSCLRALEKGQMEIALEDVLSGVKREMHKEGKPFVYS